MSYVFDGISVQNQRAVNMDSLMIKRRRISEREYVLALVCDGVGSIKDGAYAAARAVRYTNEWFEELGDTRRLGLRFKETTSVIDHRILKESEIMRLRTASTLSSILIEENAEIIHYYLVHTGDSRIFLYESGVLRQLTIDQVYEGKLTSYLGRPGGASLLYEEGDTEKGLFLLCSDGMYKRMDMDYLLRELEQIKPTSIRKSINNLIRYVVQRGEKDNISIAIIMDGDGGRGIKYENSTFYRNSRRRLL